MSSDHQEYCLIGTEVWTSPSPPMMNAAFAAKSIDATYFAFSVRSDELEQRFKELRKRKVSGVNVTLPFKSSVMALLDETDEVSSRIGAVNVVRRSESKYVGYNTDVDGVVKPLTTRFAGLQIERALVIGAGGAARAFVEAMRRLGCGRVTVLARDELRGRRVVDEMGKTSTGVELDLQGLQEAGKLMGGEFDILFNATPIGSRGIALPEQIKNLLSPKMIVFDAVYGPKDTELIREAEERGCRVVHGYEMLLEQGVAAFELWTGASAPRGVMERAVLDFLGGEGN